MFDAPAIVLRIGFVGESGFEIHVPAQFGLAVWEAIVAAGSARGLAPFGVEAQRLLRLEKKHLLPGVDTDALSNPLEADLPWIVRLEKQDFVGRHSLARSRARGPRQRLVGFRLSGNAPIAPASLVLHEKPTLQRVAGGTIIIAGLLMFGAESLTTIGNSGVGGDLLFATAGFFWATFGTLLRLWNVPGTRAVMAVGAVSLTVLAPIYLAVYGISGLARQSLFENLLQAVVQGGIAGSLPIYLFAHAVIALGGGRAATFPALVPVFGVIIGYLALGVVPSLAQFAGMLTVLVGFHFALRR